MSAATDAKALLTGNVPHVLREYALLADGERGIVVGPRGDFAWMCFPHWDSGAIFSSLIGGQGTYAVTPLNRYVWGGYYEAGSLIWHSRWVTEDATIECREALAMPSSPDQAVLLRRVVAVRGTARVSVVLSPRADYGEAAFRGLRRSDTGLWTGRIGDTHVAWAGGETASDQPDGHGGRALVQDLQLDAGTHHDLVLVLSGDPVSEAPDPDWAWQGTEAHWADAVPAFADTVAPAAARHAYTVLSGLTGSSGGMVAAATTSLARACPRRA